MARISGMILGIGLLIVISQLSSPASAWDSDDDDDHHRKFRHPRARDFDFDDDDGRYNLRNRRFRDFDDDDHFRRGRGFGPSLILPSPRSRFGIGGGNLGIYAPPVYTQPRYHAVPQYQPVPQYSYPPSPRYQAVPQYQPTPAEPTIPIPPAPDSALGPNGYENPGYENLPIPNAPPAVSVPHERPGQFVDAAVPLYPHVRVKGLDELPRHTIHRVIAVKSPDPFRFPGCVFVRVCLPAGPCRGVEVEKGGAELELDYGELEVEITSRNGVVTVEYDD